MVAQLLKDETVAEQDREAHEQNIKDCATSSFIGRNLNHALSNLSLDIVLPPLRSTKPALTQ